MSRTARLWKGAGPLALGGLLLSSAATLAGDPPSLSDQLTELGRQAQAQGRAGDALGFYRKAIELDPKNEGARSALADKAIIRVARQDDKDKPKPDGAPATEAPPAPEPPAPAPPGNLTERANQIESVMTQQLISGVGERRQKATEALNADDPDLALEVLRQAQEAVRSEVDVPQRIRDGLSRQI
jgi:tetratricopeptide (TPR) repeat protein